MHSIYCCNSCLLELYELNIVYTLDLIPILYIPIISFYRYKLPLQTNGTLEISNSLDLRPIRIYSMEAKQNK